MTRWFCSWRRAANAQAGLLRSSYGHDQRELRRTEIVIAWPACTWTWSAVYINNVVKLRAMR